MHLKTKIVIIYSLEKLQLHTAVARANAKVWSLVTSLFSAAEGNVKHGMSDHENTIDLDLTNSVGCFLS